MNFTEKQLMILTALRDAKSLHGKNLSELMDIDQLIVAVPYTVNKQSIQFSIRSLISRGYINKPKNELKEMPFRRGKRRVVFNLTKEAENLLRSS
jgi:DNA-binding MarR family transcriptional regulator